MKIHNLIQMHIYALFLAIIGCAPSAPIIKGEPPTSAEIEICRKKLSLNSQTAKAVILGSLKDPESAKIADYEFKGFGMQKQDLDFGSYHYVDYWIGYRARIVINAKNSYGAYTGYQEKDYVISCAHKNGYGFRLDNQLVHTGPNTSSAYWIPLR